LGEVGVNDLNSNNDMMNFSQEGLFRLSDTMTKIPEALVFEGIKSFGETLVECISEIIDNFKELLGVKDNKEFDDIYVEKASEAMSEVFTSDVIKEWPIMSLEQRSDTINSYVKSLGESLGINIKGIVVGDLYAELGEGVQGMNNGSGILYLDFRNIQDPSKLGEILNTATHEARHQLQSEAIENPGKFDVPSETLKTWKENFKPGNYEDGTDDMEAYWNQPVEADARGFATSVMEAFKNGLNV
jgi:hypothetical protein